MNKKDKEELKLKSEGDLDDMLNKKKLEIVEIYAKIKAGKESNLRKVRFLRREIARILTFRKEKSLLNKTKEVETKNIK